MKLFALVLILVCGCFCFAQTDKPAQEHSDVDTIVLIKEPIIVRKTVEVKDPLSSKVGLDFQLGSSYYFSYFDVCNECKTYYDSVKATQQTVPGFRISLGLVHSGKKLFKNLYLGFNQNSTRFLFQTTLTTNRYQYYFLGGELGMPILRRNILTTTLGLSSELQIKKAIKGFTLQEENSKEIIALEEARVFRKNFWNIGGVIRNTFSINSFWSANAILSYRFDLSSNTIANEPFIEQRQYIILTGGLIYFFH